MGQGARSLLDLQNAVSLSATDATTLNNLGLTYRAMGNFGAAAELFERALAAEPDNPTLHNNLSQVISYQSSTTHLDKLKKTLSKVGPQSLESAPLHFALFKALDELNDVDEAFKHLQIGNMLAKTASGYEFASEGVPYGLSKLLFEHPIDMSIEFDKSEISPIFVTGLPRSGTTLVERILSQAPSVRPCGELTIVPLAMGPLLSDVAKRKAKSLSLDDLMNLRNVIQSQFSHYLAGQERPIDKMPTNYRWIGYLCLALPEAHVIHLNRNAISVAWSLYRHLFTGHGVGYSNDFEDIAKAMVMHRDLMDLWRGRFPNRVIDVQYHQLVHSPEFVTKSLADVTDLTWSPDWVEPDTGRSEIRTASAQQARQSIYTQSDEAWRKYERQLSPLMDMLTSINLL
jgi:tetratricopeptide (TPR) repeat protein